MKARLRREPADCAVLVAVDVGGAAYEWRRIEHDDVTYTKAVIRVAWHPTRARVLRRQMIAFDNFKPWPPPEAAEH